MDNMDWIARIDREAKALGMTYGEYVGRLRTREVVSRNERTFIDRESMEPRECVHCGATFWVPTKGTGRIGNKKYCSRECCNAATRQRLRERKNA